MSYGKRVSASSASLYGGSGALLLDPTGPPMVFRLEAQAVRGEAP